MITKKKRTTAIFAAVFLILGVLAAHYLWESWGFYRKVPEKEAALRTQVVETAERYLGCQEADGSFKTIIDLYNSQESLPMGYEVQYTDSWCAVFVSAVAMECGITDILPTECSCERQIGLFQDLGRWEEDDSAIPLPGDVIYYDWDEKGLGDCTGWADHVGIVVGTKWPFLKVIEGNRDDAVTYRILPLNDIHIRGFGLPDYTSHLKNTP